MDGIELCKQGISISSADWDDEKEAIKISFSSSVATTLASNGFRILTSCSCRAWRPGLQCPHVVVAWAALKRLVSPESLFQIRFSAELLVKMALLAGLEQPTSTPPATPARVNAVISLHEARSRKIAELAAREAEKLRRSSSGPYRLLLKMDERNSLDAGIYRGAEQVQRWSCQGAPVDIQRFLMTHFYFDASHRYFDNFLTITKGKYPIVFLSEDGGETTLDWQPDSPLNATLTFDLQDNEVYLTRTLDNGQPIPEKAIVQRGVLCNLTEGALHPLFDQGPWKTYEQIEDQLYAADDELELDDDEDSDDFYVSDDDDQDDEPDDAGFRSSMPDIYGLPHGICVTQDLFNDTAIRLMPEVVLNKDSGLFFKQNNNSITINKSETPEYVLNIPNFADNTMVDLVPLGMHDTILFPFSSSTFWLLTPQGRSHLSTPLKAKKRVRYLLETAFSLLDETKSSVRTKLISKALSTPDFIKRDIKRDARQLLNHFLAQCALKPLLTRAVPDGWQFVEDNRAAQAQLVRIIFELFGPEPFADGLMPAAVRLPAPLFMQELPKLAQRLEESGFALHFDHQPLATGTWQFSLDATHSSMDWFELKPEIRVNGELLTDQELQELLGGNGMLRKDGRLLLLDELSSQILAMFSGAVAGKKSKKGKQELVRVPRLQILDWLQLRRHGVEVKLAPQDAGILDSLLNFDQLPKPALPVGLVADLRHYQLDAWYWLAFLYQHRFGACLADDMGLGKTLQGITLMAGIMAGTIPSAAPIGSPHLVVAPPSLLFNWEAEITRFLPSAKVLLYAGTGRSTNCFSEYDIIITSYGIVQRDHAKLEELRFDVVIFDETQVVKNLQAATTNAVRKLKGAFILALTGTPVENHLGEYYAIMDLCLPGLLGRHDEFNRQISKGGPPATQRLIQRTKPFVLRRTKQMIASELPPKIETDIQLELSPKQKVFYQRTIEEVKGQVQDAYQNHAPAQARIIALTAILRLRQICLAPALAAATASEASPKLEFLAEQLLELRDEGHSVLVFSQFTGYLDIIEKGLKQQGLACLRLDGSTPVPKRKNLVQSFQDSVEPIVFLISLKAGGKGLNLTRATYVYHMDPWWNPAVENQASDRAHRIGQTEQVTITRLIMRHTIEEKMMALKARKLELYKALLEDGTGSGGSGLTREDFEFLLG